MNYKFIKVSLTLFVVFISISINAQEVFTVNGSVYSETDSRSIPGAQIFINGSTIGTLSDNEGNFVLRNIPEGKHELIIQVLGFNSVKKTISTESLESNYEFILNEKIYNLDQITVEPDTEDWEYNFEEFQDNFIGKGPFSKNTIIKNRDVINFDYDSEKRTLTTFAYERLIIENKDLGYTVYFYLEDFQLNYKEGTTSFYGQTFFEELKSNRSKTNRKWNENRKKAYLGSFLHFTHSLIDGQASQNGYVIKGEKREPKARYVSKDTVSTTQFFQPIDSSTFAFSFINFLNVTYTKEYEDISYLRAIAKPLDSNPRTLVDFQNSSFTLLEDSVLLDKNGFLLSPTSILFDGYWGFEKLSDMLPNNYTVSID
ncbi:MAG: carboxypeptidase-like regulatory domain-containing protein [Balneola sp.]